VHAYEVDACEIYVAEMYAAEIHAAEMQVCDIYACEACKTYIRKSDFRNFFEFVQRSLYPAVLTSPN
jgi:hypothetical protein